MMVCITDDLFTTIAKNKIEMLSLLHAPINYHCKNKYFDVLIFEILPNDFPFCLFVLACTYYFIFGTEIRCSRRKRRLLYFLLRNTSIPRLDYFLWMKIKMKNLLEAVT